MNHNSIVHREMLQKTNMFIQQKAQSTIHSNDMFIGRTEQPIHTSSTSTNHSKNLFTGQIKQLTTNISVRTNNLKRSAVDVLSLFGGLGDSQSQEAGEEDEKGDKCDEKCDVSVFSSMSSGTHLNNYIRKTHKTISSHQQTNKENTFQKCSTQQQTINKIDKGATKVLLGAANSIQTTLGKHDVRDETSFQGDSNHELLLTNDDNENLHNNDKSLLIDQKENFECEEDFFSKEFDEESDIFYKDIGVSSIFIIIIVFHYFSSLSWTNFLQSKLEWVKFISAAQNSSN